VTLMEADTHSTRAPTPVMRRETLWSGDAVVEVQIPQSAIFFHGNAAENIPQYLKFPMRFGRTKGLLNVFVHTSDESLRAKSIKATLSVLEKTLSDGRKYLHVDLVPVSAGSAVTHVLKSAGRGELRVPSNSLSWNTSPPLNGVIVLMPIEAHNASHDTGGDKQLARLLSEGWQIASENDKIVNLEKGHRTLTHFKPKK
jgi:hypothetical protein